MSRSAWKVECIGHEVENRGFQYSSIPDADDWIHGRKRLYVFQRKYSKTMLILRLQCLKRFFCASSTRKRWFYNFNNSNVWKTVFCGRFQRWKRWICGYFLQIWIYSEGSVRLEPSTFFTQGKEVNWKYFLENRIWYLVFILRPHPNIGHKRKFRNFRRVSSILHSEVVVGKNFLRHLEVFSSLFKLQNSFWSISHRQTHFGRISIFFPPNINKQLL